MWPEILAGLGTVAAGVMVFWRAYAAGKKSGLQQARTEAAETVVELAKKDAVIDRKKITAREILEAQHEQELNKKTLEEDLKKGHQW